MTTEEHKMADCLLLREGGGVLTPDVTAEVDVVCGNSRVGKRCKHPPSLTRRVTALTDTLTLWERVVEATLRAEVSICKERHGFMPKRVLQMQPLL